MDIEVADKEMRPELIKALHVVMIVNLIRCWLLSLLQSVTSEVVVRFRCTIIWQGIKGGDSCLSVLDPKDWWRYAVVDLTARRFDREGAF